MANKPDNRYVRYYTAGSAARKLAPQVQEFPAKAPKSRKAKRITVYVDPVAILGIVTAVFMMICLAIGLVELNHARTQQAVMTDYVRQLTVTNGELNTKYYSNIDLEQIRESAMTLGMVPAEQVTHIALDLGAN